MNDELRRQAWDRSYQRRENFLFYPHEEIVRFVSRYIRKRVGYASFEDQHPDTANIRILDLGCGIGRHVRFCDDLQLQVWGIDLSETAIAEARHICEMEGRHHLLDRFHIGSITNLPYSDDDFDFIISHGVLDSLPYVVADQIMKECRRVLKPAGRFYVDLISGDDDRHYPEYSGEEVVKANHEQDTVQTHFNFARLQALASEDFAIEQCRIIRSESVISQHWRSRYHAVLKPHSV